MNAEFIDRLAQGLSAMGVPYRAPMLETLARFQEKLLAANARMNLTRVGAEACEAVDRNYLDSLAPLAQGLLQGAKAALDVGSGAGFPGIPLCVLVGEETRFVLVDSLGKRVAFLNEAIAELRLNAEAVHARMEDFARANRERFDVATARAVAPVGVLAELALPVRRGRSGRRAERAAHTRRRERADPARSHPRPGLGAHAGGGAKSAENPRAVSPQGGRTFAQSAVKHPSSPGWPLGFPWRGCPSLIRRFAARTDALSNAFYSCGKRGYSSRMYATPYFS